MSALIAAHQKDKDTIVILTDGMAIDLKTGAVGSVHPKQLFLPSGTVLAGMGCWTPCVRFARRAAERTSSFDELGDATEALWKEVRATLTAEYKVIPCCFVLAGYSTKKGRVEMHVLVERDGDCRFQAGAIGYLAGPGDNADPAKPFAARLYANPNEFDVHHDGIEFMGAMRRDALKVTEAGPRPAVGGFVQCTTVTADRLATSARANIETRIVRHWPDQAGHPVDPDAPAEENGDLTDLAKARDAMVRRMAEEASAGPLVEEVNLLRAHPDIWPSFDRVYGGGAATEYFHWDGSGAPLTEAARLHAEAAEVR